MKLNYEELEQLRILAVRASKTDLAKKLENMAEEEWNPGTSMPPLYQTIIIWKHKEEAEFKVRRVELLSAYTGRGEKSYNKVKFVYVDSNEEFEIAGTAFEWRRV